MDQLEVTFDPNVEYQRLEDVVIESTEPLVDRTGNGPRDVSKRLKPATPFQNQGSASGWNDVKPTFRNGADFARLLSLKPDNVIEELGERIVAKIGEVPCKDSETKMAFGQKDMITRGLGTLKEPDYKKKWKDYICEEARNSLYSEQRSLSEPVTLAVYAVDIKNAAAPLDEGLLTPLLKNVDEGLNSVDIWDIPAMRAIVEYKWHSWARKYLLIEFALYMAWLISFLAFIVLYIQYNLKRGFVKGQANQSNVRLVSLIFDVSAAAFMLPFIAINIKSVVYYKWKWLQMWNAIDCIAYVLQAITTINHLIGFEMDDDAYKSILAIQCTVLFAKVQYFFRVVGVGASYIETLRAVVYDVRYFIAFVITSTMSASLSFAVLYSEHEGTRDGKDQGANDFGTVPRSLVTTSAVLLGSFDPAYVFHTENSVIKGISFLFFQFSMSILVLNLLIAVVTQSYTNIMAKKRALYNKGRAQLIGELEVSLPKYFRNELKPYIHFAVISRRDHKEYELSSLRTLPFLSDSSSSGDMHSRLKGIETLIINLHSKFDRLQNQVRRLEKAKSLEEEDLFEGL